MSSWIMDLVHRGEDNPGTSYIYRLRERIADYIEAHSRIPAKPHGSVEIPHRFETA